MAKLIKRVGIVILMIVVTCLLLISSMLVINVTEDSNKIASADSQINISTEESVGKDVTYSGNKGYAIPTADIEVDLKHIDGCTDTTTCTCMQDGWNEITTKSSNTNKLVKVILQNHWSAREDANFITSFGEGFGFDNGRIYLQENVKIILDLNGKTIDRDLKNNQNENGAVIVNEGDLIITDNKYDFNKVMAIYNECKSEGNDLVNLKNKFIASGYGTITGGATNIKMFGSGVRSLTYLTIHSGIICDNIAESGAGIFATGRVNLYGGLIVNNIGNNGAGVHIYKGVLNVNDGMILNNKAQKTGGGGILCEHTEFNLLGGEVRDNFAKDFGGGVYLSNHSTINIYGGKISYNRMARDITSVNNEYGVGVYCKNSNFYMYSGEISNNYDGRCGGGLALDNGSYGALFNGKIKDNEVIVNSAGVLVYRNSKMEMYGGEISGNIIDRVDTKNRTDAGAGIGLQSDSGLILNGGSVINNKIINGLDTIYGGGIFVRITCKVILNGGTIASNTIESDGIARGAGVFFEENKGLNIGGPVQIYGNSLKDKNNTDFINNDVFLSKNFRLFITGTLCYGGFAKIGVTLADDYSINTEDIVPFTCGFSMSNSFDPKLVFFSNNENKIAKTAPAVNGLSDVAFFEGNKPDTTVTWSWSGDESGSTAELINVNVTYTGNPFTIQMEDKNFYQQGVGSAKSFTVDKVGTYEFFTYEDYLNPTFVLTILPKEVDIVWGNTNLTFNGGVQKPTATIAEDSNCKVTLIGDEINAGNGYVATATGLSNSNYTIKNNTSSVLYNISKAKLTKPNGSGSFEYDGSAQTYLPNGYNMVTMDITGNKATEVGSYNAVVSIKDKHNYEWIDGTNEDITLSYAITLAPPVNEETGVYRFIYLAEEGDKQVRKTYKESGLVHGINDSEVNGGKAVIGNIAPNTSVKEFIETLGFDTIKIVLKDNKGKDIYKNNAPVDSATYDNKYELAVGTGWRVEYTNNGNTETIYLSVLGDVTGDGRIKVQ